MYRIILFLCIVTFSCKGTESRSQTSVETIDNEELKVLFIEDQGDRMNGVIDWSVVSKRDKQREVRVFELLDSSLVRTSLDYSNAAMIFQHGTDTVASDMAVKMMRKAIELNPSINKWLLAAAIDRDLMRRDKPQIYGTQYIQINDQPLQQYKIDTTKVMDEERRAYGVETLAEQREKVRMMNKKKLSELVIKGKSANEIVAFCRREDKAQSEYDLSENGINSFGYELLAQERYKEALKVLELNTELYPERFNTYDSLGECLLKLGRKGDAIAAYRKSLELNPENTNAEEVLAEIEAK